MNEPLFDLDKLLGAFQGTLTQVINYLPRIAAALVILIIGWLIARLLRVVISKIVQHIDLFWQRILTRRGFGSMQRKPPPVRVVSEIFYWLTLVIFLTLAADVLGLDIFVVGLKKILGYFPLVIGGLLIMMVGFVISSLVRDVVATASASAELIHGDLLARSAQLVILFIAIILGIEQIGINTTFLSVVAGIFLATMLGGFALAFGFGARTHVSNVISANQLKLVYQVGDKIRIADVEGRITEIGASRVIIETESGTMDVPASLFDEEVSVILEKAN